MSGEPPFGVDFILSNERNSISLRGFKLWKASLKLYEDPCIIGH